MSIQILEDVTVELVQSCGGDPMVVKAARVSVLGGNDGGKTQEADDGLVGYLARDRHGSPFEHNIMTFYVKAPIFAIREFMRHRIGFSYSEKSGRYSELDSDFFAPDAERPLVQTGKPGHYTFEVGDAGQIERTRASIAAGYEAAWASYRAMIDDGVAKEIARVVLPVGIYSEMYVSCNARSMMAFLSLRTHEATATFPSKPQREIEMVARKMEAVFADLFPVTYAAWVKNGRVSP